MRLLKFVLLPLVALGLLVSLYFWAALSWSYSTGERAGWVQKLSRKGWVCKTWEGELALYVVPGMAPEIWEFSVRDKAVADQLAGFIGERVQLHYSEHRALPTSCFGETGYFVDRVTPAPASVEAPTAPATP